MLKQTSKNRQQVREDVRNDVLTWYVLSTGDKPQQQCLDEKSYDSKTLWWLEPLVPGVDNPVVIEEEKRDGQWTIRIEPRATPIQVFVP